MGTGGPPEPDGKRFIPPPLDTRFCGREGRTPPPKRGVPKEPTETDMLPVPALLLLLPLLRVDEEDNEPAPPPAVIVDGAVVVFLWVRRFVNKACGLTSSVAFLFLYRAWGTGTAGAAELLLESGDAALLLGLLPLTMSPLDMLSGASASVRARLGSAL